MAENPPDAEQRAFRTAIGEALARIDHGERGAADLSGVSRGTWSDTKKGKTVPKPPTWQKMKALLRSNQVRMPGTDWDALYWAARSEKDKLLKQPGQKPAPSPGRHFLGGLDSIQSFALPIVDRLGLVRDKVPDWDEGTGRIVFAIGEGGLGKSILLKQAAEKLAEPRRPGGGVVVAVACGRIGSTEDLTEVQGADAAFARAAAVPEPESGIVKALERLRDKHGSVHLLIDTLDVVATEHTAHALRELLRRCARHARLFATCRKREYSELFTPDPGAPWNDGEPPALITMPDLSEDEIVEWAERYVSELDLPLPQRERFIGSLSDPARARTIKRICAVPLRLAMTCRLFSDKGRLPADLTITGLYEAYWIQRIARDRHNMRTSRSKRQEGAAFALAELVLDLNPDRLTLAVALDGWDASIGALVSDGVVLDRGGRYEFFHQTFAEFAIAVLLAQRAEDARLVLLRSELDDASSRMWPIALHLMLLQETPESRHEELLQYVPIDSPLGSQYHLLSASTRGVPERLEAVFAQIARRDDVLMRSMAGLLGDAHPDCAEAALTICIWFLTSHSDRYLIDISRAIGALLLHLPPEQQRDRLATTLDLIEDIRPGIPMDTWVNVPYYLVEYLCKVEMDSALFSLLCKRYEQLGPRGQRELLTAALKSRAAEPSRIAVLAEPMLSASPPDIGSAEGVELLRWCMDDPGVCQKFGWGDWTVLLETELPDPWDAMQIRLVRELCRDDGIRDELMSLVLSDAPVSFPKRWTNTAKFVADDFPSEVGTALGGIPGDAGRSAIGKALALAKHVSGVLPKQDRLALIEAFIPHTSADPRQVWTALIQLAGADVDLHEELLDSFYRADREMHPLQSGEKPNGDWTAVRLSPIGNWLRTAPVEFLFRQRERFRTMLPAAGGDEMLRRARFEGRIAHLDQQARAWLSDQIMKGTNASAALRGLEEADRTEQEPDTATTAWRCALLRTPHTDVAIKLANFLADPDATPGTLLSGLTLDTDGSETPLSDLLTAAATGRLKAALDSGEHTNLVKALLSLVFRIDESHPLDPELVKEIVTGTAAPVIRLNAEPRPFWPGESASEASTSFARWSTSVRKIGLIRLPFEDIRPTVESVLTGWDCAGLGTPNRRRTASLIRSVLDRSPNFAAWLEKRLWPAATSATKHAIAEAIVIHERAVPGNRALRLSQREDCPHDVRMFIHKKLETQT